VKLEVAWRTQQRAASHDVKRALTPVRHRERDVGYWPILSEPLDADVRHVSRDLVDMQLGEPLQCWEEVASPTCDSVERSSKAVMPT
jgi:hypothetical protein